MFHDLTVKKTRAKGKNKASASVRPSRNTEWVAGEERENNEFPRKILKTDNICNFFWVWNPQAGSGIRVWVRSLCFPSDET